MAKNRMVNTRIWSDPRVLDLDPSEKLLWVYLITNDHTSICGIYEIHPRVIAMETGFDKDMIEKILTRFTIDKKIKRYKNRIHIIKFTEHQANNPSVQKGIERELDDLSDEVKNGLSNSIIQPVPSLGQLGLLNLTKHNLTKENTTDIRSSLFSEFISQYPNKDGRAKAEEKYPIKEHNKIMLGLERQKKKRDYLATIGEFVPSRPMVSTWISQKRWLDIEDDKEIENITLPNTDLGKAELYVKIGRPKYKELFGIDETAYANQQRNILLVR